MKDTPVVTTNARGAPRACWNVTASKPVKTITCPDCGLVVTIAPDTADATLGYDFNDWQRRCKRHELDGPLWCMIQRDGDSKKQKSHLRPRGDLTMPTVSVKIGRLSLAGTRQTSAFIQPIVVEWRSR